MGVEDTELWQDLPDDQKELPVLSFSQLQMYDKCQFQWYMAYKLGYIQQTKKRALEIGSLVHEGLAEYYQGLMDAQGNGKGSLFTAEAFAKTRLPQLTAKWVNNDNHDAVVFASHATWLLDRYLTECEYYDAGHRILAVEKHFLIPVTSMKGKKFLLQGYIDLITLDHAGRVWLWDHKTGKFWTPYEVLMDPQLPTYCIVLHELGFVPSGSIINMLNNYDYKDKSKVKNEQLFKRDTVSRTEQELENIARTILARADDWLDAVEAPKQESKFLRSMSKDCATRCAYCDPCSQGLKGIPVEVVLDAAYKKKEEKKTPQSITIEGFESV